MPSASDPVPADFDTRLGGFDSVELHEIDGAPMSDRFEAKFAAPSAALDRILDACQRAGYRMLRVVGRPVQHYTTTYYDTGALKHYHDHRVGRGKRAKVRIRRYDATDARFLEVKLRQNNGRTLKHRVLLNGDEADDLLPPATFPAEAQGVVASASPVPVVRTRFNRITFLDSASDERITVDIDVELSASGQSVLLAGAVLIEIKQHRRSLPRFQRMMVRPRVRESSVSKYCLGVAFLRSDVRHNRFKPQMRALTALSAGHPRGHCLVAAR